MIKNISPKVEYLGKEEKHLVFKIGGKKILGFGLGKYFKEFNGKTFNVLVTISGKVWMGKKVLNMSLVDLELVS